MKTICMTIIALGFFSLAANAAETSLDCWIQINPIRGYGVIYGTIPMQRILAMGSDKTSGAKTHAHVLFKSVVFGDLSLGNGTIDAEGMFFGNGGATASISFGGTTASTGAIRPDQNGLFEINLKQG